MGVRAARRGDRGPRHRPRPPGPAGPSQGRQDPGPGPARLGRQPDRGIPGRRGTSAVGTLFTSLGLPKPGRYPGLWYSRRQKAASTRDCYPGWASRGDPHSGDAGKGLAVVDDDGPVPGGDDPAVAPPAQGAVDGGARIRVAAQAVAGPGVVGACVLDVAWGEDMGAGHG
jgi:hypothetical protein